MAPGDCAWEGFGGSTSADHTVAVDSVGLRAGSRGDSWHRRRLGSERIGNGERANRKGEIESPRRSACIVHGESEVDALTAGKGRVEGESERGQVVATR